MSTKRSPINVQIVRPYMDPVERISFLVARVGITFLIGWILMLIVGTVTDWALSYWHTILALIGLRLAQLGSSYAMWTKPGWK